MTKLWQKGYKLDHLTERFMTGADPIIDRSLIKYDCIGSIAHASMLHKIGILNDSELADLKKGLNRIISLAKDGKFEIAFEDEDVHTAVENYLIKHFGEVGKKLHTARSRNDQILLDLRLYMRDYLLNITEALLHLAESLLHFAEKYKVIPIPGRTHFQRAMPSSLGLWAGAFLESLLDDALLLQTAYQIINQSPLGSAASYGVSLPIDRQYVADLLGFTSVQNNVLYANNSRGKFESIVLSALVQIMTDLSKFATDVIVFSTPEFGYLTLPEKFCPGSSLMPQKRNPDPLELIRAKASIVAGSYNQVLDVIRSLPSGYNRDFQETKLPLMLGLEETYNSLHVFTRIMESVEVNEKKCYAAFSPELFATDDVLKLVSGGMPFRDAYHQVAQNPEKVSNLNPKDNILNKKHLGATGNLGLSLSQDKIKTLHSWKNDQVQHTKSKI